MKIWNETQSQKVVFSNSGVDLHSVEEGDKYCVETHSASASIPIARWL